MNKTLREVLEHAATWPREDQDELAEYVREIEAPIAQRSHRPGTKLLLQQLVRHQRGREFKLRRIDESPLA